MSVARLRVLIPRLVRNPAFWYVVALTAATVVEDTISSDQLRRLMDWCSTNLENLKPSGHPVEALAASAFLPQESAGVWLLFALSLFSVVSVVGARKAVLLLGGVHIGVSVVTEGLVWWQIHHGARPWSDERIWDTGPSYLVVTALAFAIFVAKPLWLRLIWAGCLLAAAPSLLQGIGHADFTAVGHVLSFSIGLAVVLRLRTRRAVLGEVGLAPGSNTVPATPH